MCGLSGLCVGPDDVYLGLRGLRTLAVRLERHYQSGLAVARWLEQRPEVLRMLHPALASHPGHALWKRDFTGASGLFSIVLKPVPQKAVYAFLDALELFGIGASWGGFESLAIPFDCTSVRTATRWAPGGPTVRFHIGLEAVEDLIADLERGFAALAAAAQHLISSARGRRGQACTICRAAALSRCHDGPGKAANRRPQKTRPARREPPPHHKRADDADQRAGKHVARMMHIDDDAASA